MLSQDTMVVMDTVDMDMVKDMVTMERDLLRLMLNQDTMVVMDMEAMDMVMVMVEDMVTMERDLLRLSLVMDTEAMDMVALEDIGVMEAMILWLRERVDTFLIF